MSDATPNPLENRKLQAEINKINSEKEKADAERRKIILESSDLQLPWYKKYQFWANVTPAILAAFALIFALCTNFFEARTHELNATSKEIKISIDSLNSRKDTLSKQLTKTSSQLDSAKKGLKEDSMILDDARSRFAEASSKLKDAGKALGVDSLALKNAKSLLVSLSINYESLRERIISSQKRLDSQKNVIREDSITIRGWKENFMHLEDRRAMEKFMDTCSYYRTYFLDMQKRYLELKEKYEPNKQKK